MAYYLFTQYLQTANTMNIKLERIGKKMNRVKRDYCNRGIHPNWRAWEARYDMKTWRWEFLGAFCIYCGAKLSNTKASGKPNRWLP